MIWIQCNMDIFSINHTHIKSTQIYYKPRILTMSLWKKYKGTWLWLLLKDSAHKKFFFFNSLSGIHNSVLLTWPSCSMLCDCHHPVLTQTIYLYKYIHSKLPWTCNNWLTQEILQTLKLQNNLSPSESLVSCFKTTFIRLLVLNMNIEYWHQIWIPPPLSYFFLISSFKLALKK